MESIHIIIADDHKLFADGLSTILQQQEHICIEGIAASGDELLAMIRTKEPQLVLLDISMPGMDGLVASEKILTHFPSIRILVVTMNDSVEILTTLMGLGVHGIILKNISKVELLLAIDQLQQGNTYYSQGVTRQLASRYRSRASDDWQLTKREKEVLQLIYEGLSTQEIAMKLFISHYTVETHRKNLFLKTGLNKSAQLIKKALELGYINKQ